MVNLKLFFSRSGIRNYLIAIGVLLLLVIGLDLAKRSSNQILNDIALILMAPEFIRAALIAATPLLLAALGGLMSELSGVLNMALESMMLIGAFVGYAVSDYLGNPWFGLFAAALAGMLVGLIHAIFTINLRSNQVVSAVALNLFAVAVTALSFRILYVKKAFVSAPGFNDLDIPLLSDLPYIGTALFQHNIIIYLALLFIPVMWFIIYKTSWGLTLRSVGEHPMASSTVGINVNRVRYIAVLLSGIIVGISGSALVSASGINAFQENLSAGRGFIAFSAIVFGRYNPISIFLGTILFGLGDAFQIRLQTYGVEVPYQLLLMLPYLITLMALVAFMRNARGPAASGTPFIQEG
jgi:ABC-type uncharacterized transport system permease subunit